MTRMVGPESGQSGRNARFERRRKENGWRRVAIWLPEDERRQLDKALQRTGLSLTGFLEGAIEHSLAQRLPDAPFARHIPKDYRSQEAVGRLFQYGIAIAQTHADALRKAAMRSKRLHPHDPQRAIRASEEADLAFGFLAFLQDLDTDQGLREHVFRSEEEGGRKVRDRSKAARQGTRATAPRDLGKL